VFAEGVSGRRARIAGTGIEVWEVIANYKSVEKDLNRLITIYHWLTEIQLRAALAYYSAYPDEIEDLMAKNEIWTRENVQKRYPLLTATRA